MVTSASPGAPRVNAAEIRVLVVDDSPTLRKSVIYALQKIDGVVCVEAADGVEAVRRLGQETFHAVMCDINMPVMDGLKVIGWMRGRPDLAGVPVVVITTESAEEDRRRALALGANRYLVKPVQSREVVDAVRELLHL